MISDGVLAIVTIASAVGLVRRREPTMIFGAACFIFIGLTAAVGALRYGGVELAFFHHSMNWTCRMIAVPALGLAFVVLSLGVKVIRPAWLAIGFALGGLGWALPGALGVVPAAVGQLLILGVGLRYARAAPKVAAAAVLGVVIYLVAGLVVGTSGFWGPLKRVDIFHYALAFAHPLLAYAMIGVHAQVSAQGV